MYNKNHFNYCPKCSLKEIDYNFHHHFYKCEHCDFQFYINQSAAVAAIIINENDEILLTKRKVDPCKGMFDLPGGFVNINETAENALIREINEELNLDVLSYEYLTSQSNEYLYNDVLYYTLDLAYLCKVNGFKDIKAQDDVSDFNFFKPENINLEMISFTSIRKIIELYVKQIYKK